MQLEKCEHWHHMNLVVVIIVIIVFIPEAGRAFLIHPHASVTPAHARLGVEPLPGQVAQAQVSGCGGCTSRRTGEAADTSTIKHLVASQTAADLSLLASQSRIIQ